MLLRRTTENKHGPLMSRVPLTALNLLRYMQHYYLSVLNQINFVYLFIILVFFCRITDQRYERVPYFVFGDFNFRLDSKQVIEVGHFISLGYYLVTNHCVCMCVYTQNSTEF